MIESTAERRKKNRLEAEVKGNLNPQVILLHLQFVTVYLTRAFILLFHHLHKN